jgi:phosphatidylinositol 3-kinase
MFHIDFGFIFGQDPKPMPPPFRFIRAMADAMGGEDAENYARFKTFCCQVSLARWRRLLCGYLERVS